MRTTNRVLMAAAASVMALALTGCGSDDGGSKVPTAGGATSGTGTGGTGSGSGGSGGGGGSGDGELAAYIDGKRAFVKCLRENGIDAPDPDANGQVDLGDNAALKKNPTFLKASEKCAAINPPVPEAVEKSLQPKLSPEQIKIRRDYAECMQKNGAPDFPEPAADGYDAGDIEWDQTSAGAKRATRTCAPIIGDPVDPGPGKG
ncbi:hypothetical protein Q5762_30115 [Streptomyces sp. P9(2023)]|uniref:hypothetical protein n=1 Tax=Streptomyces sp. P9(2023) TaxID=3064394 RepID=UPI0028F45201|nr:hypothetical protein [Streptomyces sp. P9(2023)]MDT9692511.1 hypothetical protein [Streptomyces sp. P9(2023)]